MATVPKTTAVTHAAPAHSARNVAVGARVASSTGAPIENLDIGSSISFDVAANDYQDQQSRSDLGDGGGSRRRYSDPGADRLFTANSNVFASIMESSYAKDTRPVERSARRGNGATVSKIINTYETNSLIVTGQQPIRGTSFSFNL